MPLSPGTRVWARLLPFPSQSDQWGWLIVEPRGTHPLERWGFPVSATACALPPPLVPQVMGLGLSSVFALCLGHTSSFCASVVCASVSIGLQTFNHR